MQLKNNFAKRVVKMKGRLYKTNKIDRYALHYFPDTKQAEALHIGSYIGAGKPFVLLENIENEEEAIKKLKEAINKV